jgi:hypothetical protein
MLRGLDDHHARCNSCRKPAPDARSHLGKSAGRRQRLSCLVPTRLLVRLLDTLDASFGAGR